MRHLIISLILLGTTILYSVDTAQSPIILTLPKAGTYLARSLVEAITQKQGVGPTSLTPYHFHSFDLKKVFAAIHVNEEVVYTRNYIRAYPKCPKVLIVRNLKDITVSAKDFMTKKSFGKFELFDQFYKEKYPHIANLKEHWDALDNDLKLSYFIEYFKVYSAEDFKTHMKHNLEIYCQEAMDFAKNNPDALIIRFEDFFTEENTLSPETVGILASYLGYKYELPMLQTICKLVYGNPKSTTFRPGKKLYRFRDEFKPEHYEAFEIYFGNIEAEYYDFFGYGKDGVPLYPLALP